MMRLFICMVRFTPPITRCLDNGLCKKIINARYYEVIFVGIIEIEFYFRYNRVRNSRRGR